MDSRSSVCFLKERLSAEGVANTPSTKISESHTSLVSYGQNPTNGFGWSRKQKRIYQRLNTMLLFWMANGYQILWVCLTSSSESVEKELVYNRQRLVQKIERMEDAWRKGKEVPFRGFKGIEHFTIRTNEGYGVLHEFWAWKPQKGERERSFYIPQNWLSKEWKRLHNAKIVWIRKAMRGDKSKKRLSRYCVTQYCSSGEQKLRNCSWSWKRGLGGALVRTWVALKEALKGVVTEKREVIEAWGRIIRGKRIRVAKEREWELWVFEPPPKLGYRRSFVPFIRDMDPSQEMLTDFIEGYKPAVKTNRFH